MQTTVSDMDPDMRKIFSFSITLSVLPVETCVIPLLKVVFLWLHFFFLHLRALSNLWERYDLKTKRF